MKTRVFVAVCFFFLSSYKSVPPLKATPFRGALPSAISQDAADSGLVIKIVDGDTYDLLLDGKTTVRIRMSGIDAPERGQPYYQKAKDFLGSLCFQKIIRLERYGKDRYGRVIADSYSADGSSLSDEMVKGGFAWQFLKYDHSEKLAALEAAAKKSHLGLWADATPEQPWEFRSEKKLKAKKT